MSASTDSTLSNLDTSASEWLAKFVRETIPRSWVLLVARRRIAISLFVFASLIAYNVCIQRPIPFNPFDVSNPWVMAALGMILSGMVIRSWAAGTLNKSQEITSVGPYALTRNPLYIGSFLLMFGFCVLCKDLLTAIFVMGPMAGLYFLQVQFEEERLDGMFTDSWRAYRASVPRFVPRHFSNLAWSGWSVRDWMRNREYRLLLASLGALLVIYGWHVYSSQV